MSQFGEGLGDFGDAGKQAFADVNAASAPDAAVASPAAEPAAPAPQAEPAVTPPQQPTTEPAAPAAAPATPSYLEEPAPAEETGPTRSVTWDDSSYDLTDAQINALAYRGYRGLLAEQQGGGQEPTPAAPTQAPAFDPATTGAAPQDPVSLLAQQVQQLTGQLQEQQQVIQQSQVNEQTRQINHEIETESAKFQIFKDSPELAAAAKETVYSKLFANPGASTAQIVKDVATTYEKGVRAITQTYLSGKLASSQSSEGGTGAVAATPGAQPLTKASLFNGDIAKAVKADLLAARNSQG